jgi:hypothetical protein
MGKNLVSDSAKRGDIALTGSLGDELTVLHGDDQVEVRRECDGSNVLSENSGIG